MLRGPHERARRFGTEEVETALQCDQQPALAAQRDAAGRLGHRQHLHVFAVVALDRAAVDIHPPQHAHALVPDDAFAELVAAVDQAVGDESHVAE